jgi:putative ABC transport system permease protein
MWLKSFLRRVQGFWLSETIHKEIGDELQFHIDMRVEENIRRGMSPDEARRDAERRFGNQTRIKEQGYDVRGGRWLETVWQDLCYGARMLMKNPGFTFVAVLTLALGIGANTAIFSVVNAVLLQSLPYRDSDRIVTIFDRTRSEDSNFVNGSDFLDWRAQSQVIEQIVAYAFGTADLTGSGEPERLEAGFISAGLFATLGVEPSLGRAFVPTDDRAGATPVVILSHSLWRRRFGGDPQVIGQALTLDGQSRTVVGIMPPGFQFRRELDLWLPLAPNVDQEHSLLNVIARLKPGVTPEGARADLTAIMQRGKQGSPDTSPNTKLSVIKLRDWLVGDVELALLVLFGAVAFVLLIACANVANLLLARSTARRKEMAIRAVLGAGRFRLVRQLLTENLLLSFAGGATGLLLATWGVKLLVALSPAGVIHIKESSPFFLMDGRALGFTCVVAAIAGLFAGVFPALQASRTDVHEPLNAQSAARAGSRSAHRTLPVLMIVELALTLVLLVGAGLMLKSFLRLLAVPKGFNPDNVLTLDLSPSVAKYPPGLPGSSLRRAYNQELLARVQALPGVQSAALTSFVPLGGTTRRMPLQIEGRPPSEKGKEPIVEITLISPEYFQTMGLQMRAGRPFTVQDGAESPHVAIINETSARRFFPDENPIGQRLASFRTPKTIVGMVGDTRHFGLDRETNPEIYLPYLQDSNLVMSLVVRSGSDPTSLTSAIRNQVRAMEPNEPVNQIVMMDERLSDSVAPRRFQMLLLGVFAALGLVIATVGIYGVISYAISQRTHEIGIRLALGAQASDVLQMVVWRGMILTLIGVAIGLAAALALTRVMKNLLFGVSATDPATLAVIALLLVGVTLVACWIPARRATKIDPIIALKCE